MSDQMKENERTKEAIEKENEFLKEEVIGKGVETPNHDKENMKTDTEKSIED